MRPFINVPYDMVEPNLARIVSLGIGIEVHIHNNLLHNLDRRQVRGVGQRLAELQIPCTFHAPFMDLSPGGFDERIVTLTRDTLKRSLEMAVCLGAISAVFHPGYDRWRFGDHQQLWLDQSVETWTMLLRESPAETAILLENVFEEEPSTLVALFKEIQKPNFGFCFDAGHFNLFSRATLRTWLTAMKGVVVEMHLHDNNGSADDHKPIGTGTFPFRELKGFLSMIPRPVTYVAEVHGEATAMESIKNLKEFLS